MQHSSRNLFAPPTSYSLVHSPLQVLKIAGWHLNSLLHKHTYSWVIANGVYNNGPNIYYSGDSKNAKKAIRVMYKPSGPAYNLPTDFSDDSKMACEGASGALKTIQVTAGSGIRINLVSATSEILNKPGTGNVDWASGEFPWVHSMGAVVMYIAPCSNGDCTSFDASQASWVKLQMDGLDASQSISSGLHNTMAGKPEPYTPSGSGLWGMAKFVEDGSHAPVTIPAGLKNGQYPVRHELMAVHNLLKSGDSTSGPQVYNGCIQFEAIKGGNVELPDGTKAGLLPNLLRLPILLPPHLLLKLPLMAMVTLPCRTVPPLHKTLL